MRDYRDYYKSKRWYSFVRTDGRTKAVLHHHYANVHHWRMREWHGANKLYSS